MTQATRLLPSLPVLRVRTTAGGEDRQFARCSDNDNRLPVLVLPLTTSSSPNILDMDPRASHSPSPYEPDAGQT
jgi:hypothetical protein